LQLVLVLFCLRVCWALATGGLWTGSSRAEEDPPRVLWSLRQEAKKVCLYNPAEPFFAISANWPMTVEFERGLVGSPLYFISIHYANRCYVECPWPLEDPSVKNPKPAFEVLGSGPTNEVDACDSGKTVGRNFSVRLNGYIVRLRGSTVDLRMTPAGLVGHYTESRRDVELLLVPLDERTFKQLLLHRGGEPFDLGSRIASHGMSVPLKTYRCFDPHRARGVVTKIRNRIRLGDADRRRVILEHYHMTQYKAMVKNATDQELIVTSCGRASLPQI
jgi:hypothetical protein